MLVHVAISRPLVSRVAPWRWVSSSFCQQSSMNTFSPSASDSSIRCCSSCLREQDVSIKTWCQVFLFFILFFSNSYFSPIPINSYIFKRSYLFLFLWVFRPVACLFATNSQCSLKSCLKWHSSYPVSNHFQNVLSRLPSTFNGSTNIFPFDLHFCEESQGNFGHQILMLSSFP